MSVANVSREIVKNGTCGWEQLIASAFKTRVFNAIARVGQYEFLTIREWMLATMLLAKAGVGSVRIGRSGANHAKVHNTKTAIVDNRLIAIIVCTFMLNASLVW